MDWMKLAVTIIIGAAGGISAKKMKFVPAAYMLGALIAVAVFNLSTGYTYFPNELRVLTQILAGTYLGLSINKESLYSIRTILYPITLIMLMFFMLTTGFGLLIHNLFGIDLVTSLYCFAPGGISDIGIIADSLGGDVGMITFMQLVRLITVFIFYPFLFQVFSKKGIIKTSHSEKPQDNEQPSKKLNRGQSASAIKIDMSREEKIKGLAISLVFSSAGGMLGYYLGVPAGAMVFSMVSAVMVNIVYRKTYMPIQMRLFAQIMSGIYLALRITPESLAQITHSIGPVLVMILSMTTMPLVIGYIIHKATKMDLGTSFFCCTPGGMSEMTMLADDMGLDIVKVSVTHLARIIIVVSIFPQLLNIIIRFAR